MEKRPDLIDRARRYWERLDQFRRRRQRAKRYAFGDQWSDTVTTPEGETLTEEQLIRREGNTPLKNNLINRFLRNVMGVYRSQAKEPSCVARDPDERQLGETMSTVLQYNWQLNKMPELMALVMKEFLISGAAIVRKSWGRRGGKSDCWTDAVNPEAFFVDDAMRDVRGWDASVIGEIRELDFDDLVAEFATHPGQTELLRSLYPGLGPGQRSEPFGADPGGRSTPDFLTPSSPSRCRVVEIWTRERRRRYLCHDRLDASLYKVEAADYRRMVEEVNCRRRAAGEPQIEARWTVDEVWTYRYLAPDGTVLRSGDTPYLHGSHPYVFKFHPFVDGEVHSYVDDIIDQQRYVNRLITLYDWMMRSSAKGLLLFPEECLPAGMTLDDVGREWARFNGIIPIAASRSGAQPRQVSSTASASGINDLLGYQLKFFEDISGVNGALQGKPGYSGMSASLYSQQTRNSTMSLLDILDTFSDFVVEGAYKDVKNMQQFYDTRRVVAISGNGGERRSVVYDPGRIANVEFDLAVSESSQTGAYRQLANDYLMELWQRGAISARQFIRYGDFPFSSRLLNELESGEATSPEPAPDGPSDPGDNHDYQSF